MKKQKKILLVVSMLSVMLLSFCLVASADEMFGIVIDDDNTLNQTVDPYYNEKRENEYYENQDSAVVYSPNETGEENEIDSLVNSQQEGLASATDYIETFKNGLLNFQASFFAYIKVFEQFSSISVVSFLIYASVGIGLFAFLLNALPALVSKISSRGKGKG